jgi:hypothetical protein
MSTESENPFIKGNPASTRQKPGRKPMTPNFEQVVAAVERGEYDETLHELTSAINSRKEARQNRVLELVREVWGQGADVVITKTTLSPSAQPEPVVEQPEAEVDERPTDPLAHLDAVEAKMEQENLTGNSEVSQVPADQVPIEQRGAVISGLHSSDMGE